MNMGLAMPTPVDVRQTVIEQWLNKTLGEGLWHLEVASADASFRRYFRVHCSPQQGTQIRHLILMDAPPDRENIKPWLAIAQRLRQAGLHTPEIHASDEQLGLILMEDLGNRWLLTALRQAESKPQQVDTLYRPSLDALFKMQQATPSDDLPSYSEARLVAELELFPKWFLSTHLGYQPTCSEWDEIESVFTVSINQALQQPKVFVHRDYHSRNLLLDESGGDTHWPGIIDFQDAVRGPITYDLVSLLKDCYIRWQPEQVQAWMSRYHQRCLQAGMVDCNLHTFRRWFDFMGLQRHLKVLGIFCRLWYRDGKAGYLNDLPMVLDYVLEVCSRYGATLNFGRWLQELTADRDLTQINETA
jgi:aminoglycoside/choline kinase family phosphotransferase